MTGAGAGQGSALRVRGRPRPAIAPRVLSQVEVAAYLGYSVTWMQEKRAQLAAAGFPKPLPAPFLNCWDKAAVDAWLDALGGRPAESADSPSVWGRATLG
ncbi:MAG: hypothetical protein AB7P02_15800 [Alphaproteobacteria bacterium]